MSIFKYLFRPASSGREAIKKSAKAQEKQRREDLKRRIPAMKGKAEELAERYRQGDLCCAQEELQALYDEARNPFCLEKYPGFLKGMERTLEKMEDDCTLLRSGGFPLPPAAPSPAYEPEPRTIFYVAQSCIPLHTNGYAIRTHQVIKALRTEGWNAIGITRAGFPLNEKHYRTRIATEGLETVAADLPRPPRFEHDGVPYLFQPEPVSPYALGKSVQIRATADWIIAQAKEYRPAVLHAASNFANGLAALLAGRQLGIPVVYEIRGLWELTQAFNRPGFDETDQFALQAGLEAQAAREADGLFAITQGVANTLADRGVPRERFTILSNAVDPTGFDPRPRDPELEARYGTKGKVVIGYGGSLTVYEGLELLLDALNGLPDELRERVKLLIVGGGPHLEPLLARAACLGARLDITFTGRVPFEEMAQHYSLFDIAPLPRVKSPLTDAVSPIKPFELMAMKKVLIASDVDALAEIIKPGQTGLLHRAGDVDSLREGLEQLIREPELRDRLACAAREWVLSERTWSATAHLIEKTYDSLIGVKVS